MSDGLVYGLHINGVNKVFCDSDYGYKQLDEVTNHVFARAMVGAHPEYHPDMDQLIVPIKTYGVVFRHIPPEEPGSLTSHASYLNESFQIGLFSRKVTDADGKESSVLSIGIEDNINHCDVVATTNFDDFVLDAVSFDKTLKNAGIRGFSSKAYIASTSKLGENKEAVFQTRVEPNPVFTGYARECDENGGIVEPINLRAVYGVLVRSHDSLGFIDPDYRFEGWVLVNDLASLGSLQSIMESNPEIVKGCGVGFAQPDTQKAVGHLIDIPLDSWATYLCIHQELTFILDGIVNQEVL